MNNKNRINIESVVFKSLELAGFYSLNERPLHYLLKLRVSERAIPGSNVK